MNCFPKLINLGVPAKITPGSFFRTGVAVGMKIEDEVGYNPYKMGVTGGADVHSGYQGNEEFAWVGAHGGQDDTPEKRLNPEPNASGDKGYAVSSAGLTAVWATENTREAIFDAMAAKETYGTSGTMIRLRSSSEAGISLRALAAIRISSGKLMIPECRWARILKLNPQMPKHLLSQFQP